jgi:hypothetical protein
MPPPLLIFQLSPNFALLMAESYLILSLRSAVKSGGVRRQQMTYEDVTPVSLSAVKHLFYELIKNYFLKI